MRRYDKWLIVYVLALITLICGVSNLAQAQSYQVDVVAEDESEQLALIDQMLAPIALYPDTLLSHILVASTYPLEVIQAARWRADHTALNEQQAFEAVEDLGWDPSVQALIPYQKLLTDMSEDLDWLERLGNAFLSDEALLLQRVQILRRHAYDAGNLNTNEYVEVEVVEDQDIIVVEPAQTRTVYVPYYDTRVIYGDWWWHQRPPLYWSRPINVSWHAGFFWSSGFYLHPRYTFAGFRWQHRHLVVNHNRYHHPHRYDDGRRRVINREYTHWQHQSQHRRGVRYSSKALKNVRNSNKMRPVSTLGNQPKVTHQAKIKQNLQSHRAPARQSVQREANRLNLRPVNQHKKPLKHIQNSNKARPVSSLNSQPKVTDQAKIKQNLQPLNAPKRPVVQRQTGVTSQPKHLRSSRPEPVSRPTVRRQQPKVQNRAARPTQSAPKRVSRAVSTPRQTRPVKKQR